MALALAACAMSACSTDQMSEYERVKYWFTDKIGDNIGTLQYWRTAVNIKVNVITDSPAEIWLMSKEDNGIAYDFKEAKSSSTIELTAPQNDLHTVYIVAICNNVKNVQTVELTGKPEENVTLYLKDVYARTATMHNPEMKSEAKPSLSGSSVLGNTPVRDKK